MKSVLPIAMAAAVVVLLSACTVSGGPGTPVPVDEEVSARTGGGGGLSDQVPSDASATLFPGEDRVYRVNVPSSGEPALFVYLDEDLDLSLYSGSVGPGGTPFATSSSSAFFAPGNRGLQLVSGEASVEAQVVTARDCPGACIIAENPGSGAVYVRVENPTNVVVDFTLWAILTDFDDANETVASESDPLGFTETESGAIETLGDVDYFIVDDSGELFFDYAQEGLTGLQLVAEIIPFGQSTPVDYLYPGESAFVDFSDSVHVYAENDRAAVSGNSQYFLELLGD